MHKRRQFINHFGHNYHSYIFRNSLRQCLEASYKKELFFAGLFFLNVTDPPLYLSLGVPLIKALAKLVEDHA